MFRRIALGLLLLVLIAVVVPAYGCGSDLPEGAIAQVGSGVVTAEELEYLVAAYEAAGKAPDRADQADDFKVFRQRCAEYLVMLQVLYQKGPEFDVSVTEADITAGVNQIRSMFLGDEAKFNEAVARQGMDIASLRMGIEHDLWITRMKEAVTSGVVIKESEVQTYYDEHKAEYVLSESRHARHILISPFVDAAGNVITDNPTQSDWDAAEQEAAKVRSEIMNGANFVTMVENYSDDPSSQNNEGDLGEIVRGQAAPSFEQAVFRLGEGELSQPVRTPSGYSIIEVLEITPAQQLAYDSVKEQIRSKLLTEEETETWNNWLTETMLALGVAYAPGYAPPDAVIAPVTSTTVAGQGAAPTTDGTSEETTTTAAGE